MRKLSLPILLLAAAPAFGQLDSHTLTISATRSIVPQPDQVIVGLTVSSSPTATLDQIVAALSGLGVTDADFTGTENYNQPTLSWNFSFTAPLANLTVTIGSLTKLEQTITQNDSGLTLTFYIGGTQVSQQLRQSQACSNSDLIADATAQAQKLAAAAGLTLGPILKLSNAPSAQPSLAQPSLFVANGAFVGYIVPNNFLVGYVSSPVTCSLVVEFQLVP
jgi:hypothetical protein